MNGEVSPGGSHLYRYEDNEVKKFEPAIGDGENIDAISNHIEKYIGKIDSVFHEIISDQVHIDVHWVKPTSRFPFHTLLTSGMSDKPMAVPVGHEDLRYAELCILLPADWEIEGGSYKLMEEVFEEENNYWPVRWLKYIARFPHEYDTWIGASHTIPNGEHAEPFADNTNQGCMFIYPSIVFPADFHQLTTLSGKIINFYSLYPIYKEEMELKLRKGADALLDKFEAHNVSNVVDPTRVNTGLRKKFLGLW